MTKHQEAADDADRFLKSISYQSTGGKSGGSLSEALSKLREKTVARQKQFHPETPAPPRHSSHFLNVVLLDRSHSIGGGNGLSGNGNGNSSPPLSSSKERERPQSSSSSNSNPNSSFNSSPQFNGNQHNQHGSMNTIPPITGGISQKPENVFPNENGTNNLLLSSSSSSTTTSTPVSNRNPSLDEGGHLNDRRDSIENELPPPDSYTELQPYFDSFRNDSDDSFLQILEELFSS